MKIFNSTISSRQERQFDLAAAGSGYGGGGGHDDTTYCPEGVPVETALLTILGAFAASFGLLFTTITMITMMRRRKRDSQKSVMSEMLWLGRLDRLVIDAIQQACCEIFVQMTIVLLFLHMQNVDFAFIYSTKIPRKLQVH